MATRVRTSESSVPRCPLCRDDLELETVRACAGCDTRYHAACLAEFGGCSTLGCSLAGQTEPVEPEARCDECHQPPEAGAAPLLEHRRCGSHVHPGCLSRHMAWCSPGWHAQERRTEVPPATKRRDMTFSRGIRSGRDRGGGQTVIGLTLAFVGAVGILASAGLTKGDAVIPGWVGLAALFFGILSLTGVLVATDGISRLTGRR